MFTRGVVVLWVAMLVAMAGIGMVSPLLPVYVQSRVFNALLQSSAAKHAATQKAMKRVK